MSIPDPVVLLDARARYVHPAFEMARASTKTVWDSAGRLVTVPANAIGWDHDPATGQARGYLAEPGATNLLRHSNDLTQSPWTTFGASVTGDAITGPDGQGMAKLVENSSDSIHSIRQAFTITDGATVAFSPVLKAGERTQAVAYIMRESDNINHARCTVNLADGTVSGATSSGTGGLVDAQVMPLGGGFFRLALMGTLGSGVTDARVDVRLLDGNGSDSYQGDGTSGLYLGYCQAEEGSYPTSYIETGASTVTRAGDSLVLSGLGNFPWWRSERGTLLVDVDIPVRKSAGEFLSVDGFTLSMRWTSPSQNLIMPAGITDVGIILLSDNAVGRHIIALSWDDETLAGTVDGSIASVRDVIGSIPSNPSLGLGCNSSSFNHAQGAIRRAVYYPARISNADLQSLTAIQE